MTARKWIFIILAAVLTLTLACNMPLGRQASVNTNATVTAALKTAEFNATAAVFALSLTPHPSTEPSITPPSTVVPTRVPTRRPPNPPPPPPATAVTRCNWAQFIADVTIPDGTRVIPGQTFTKTWRLKNIGTCTWTTEYYMAFENGDAMGAPASVPMPEVVPPGDTIDLSVSLTAPAAAGRKTGNWKLHNPASVPFGVGFDAQSTFYVQVNVSTNTITPSVTPGPIGTVYDFTTQYCTAEWRSDAGLLPCPGTDADSTGFVIKVDAPQLENGDTYSKPGLWTHPEWKVNGAISGKYPAFAVQNGDHFRAAIACLYGASACTVRFQLNYRIGGGSLQSLGQWDQTYDGVVQNLDIDLSSLAGKNVEFVLAAFTSDAPDQDWAFWYQPRIVR